MSANGNLPSIRAIRNERDYLARIAEGREIADRIESVEGAADLAARARAAQVWAERAHLGERNVNLAIATKLWAERRGGELLAKMRDNGERARSGKESQATTLTDLGVSKHESSRWQQLAEIPADEFGALMAAAEGKITAALILKSKGRSERDKAKRVAREAAHAEAREQIDLLGDGAWRIDVADLRTWNPGPIECIATDPPYITDDAVELHSALADFAVEHLPEHGALAVMTWQSLLPEVFAAMERPELVYRWTAAWIFETPERTPERGPRVFDGWKPILVFHKNGWTKKTTYLYDLIRSSDSDKGSHEWGQSIDGFRHLVRAFSEPGQIVCDPFVGGGTTAVAALAESRRFVGCDVDKRAVKAAQARL